MVLPCRGAMWASPPTRWRLSEASPRREASPDASAFYADSPLSRSDVGIAPTGWRFREHGPVGRRPLTSPRITMVLPCCGAMWASPPTGWRFREHGPVGRRPLTPPRITLVLPCCGAMWASPPTGWRLSEALPRREASPDASAYCDGAPLSRSDVGIAPYDEASPGGIAP